MTTPRFEGRVYKILVDSLDNLYNFSVLTFEEHKNIKRNLEDLQYGK